MKGSLVGGFTGTLSAITAGADGKLTTAPTAGSDTHTFLATSKSITTNQSVAIGETSRWLPNKGLISRLPSTRTSFAKTQTGLNANLVVGGSQTRLRPTRLSPEW